MNMTTVNIANADISADGIDIDKTEISSPTDQFLILNETIDTKLDEQQSKIKIVNVYDEEANHIEIINRQIQERIDTLLRKIYNVKNDGFYQNIYYVYKKPIYTNSWFKNVIIYFMYQLDFLISDILRSDKYYLTALHLNGDTVIVNACSPQEVVKLETNLKFWFNSISDIKIVIKKVYYDCDFVKTEA